MNEMKGQYTNAASNDAEAERLLSQFNLTNKCDKNGGEESMGLEKVQTQKMIDYNEAMPAYRVTKPSSPDLPLPLKEVKKPFT